jgi:hypothetical protein
VDALDRRLMQELIKTLRQVPRENLTTFLRAHSCHGHHCDTCHTVWPCTLWSAGTAATRPSHPVAI